MIVLITFVTFKMKKKKQIPLHIDIITVLPKLIESPFQNSIVKRAIDKKLVKVNSINLRDYASDKYKSVDDYMYGGGAGMVMMIEPIAKCIEKLKKTLRLRSGQEYDEIIYMSPDGELFNQKMANKL